MYSSTVRENDEEPIHTAEKKLGHKFYTLIPFSSHTSVSLSFALGYTRNG